MTTQHRFDLAQLDPESTDLHLVVGPAEELQLAVRPPPHQVTGAVHPASGRAEGIGHEPLRRQPRTTQVPPGQARARDVQLSRHPSRCQLQPLVQDVRPAAPHRCSDGGGCGRVGAGQRLAGRRRNRRLGRSVDVQHPPSVRPARGQRRGARLAADAQHAQGGEVPRRQGREHARGHVGTGDPALLQIVAESVPDQGAGRGDDEGRAEAERAEEVLESHVEADRGQLEDPVVRLDPVLLRQRGGQRGDAAVGDGHALGGAGGARGVDGVRQVVGSAPGGPLGIRGIGSVESGQDRRVVEDQGLRAALREPPGNLAAGQHADRGGVPEHERDAVGRVCRVDREERGTGLQDAQQRRHHLHRPGHRQRHQLLGADALPDQPVGHVVGPGVQLGIGEHGALVLQRRCVGAERRLLLEQVGEEPVLRGRTARPLGEQFAPLGRGEQFGGADRQVGALGDGRQQQPETLGEPLRGGRVGQVGAVLQEAVEPRRIPGAVCGLVEVEREIEAGHVLGEVLGDGRQAGQVERGSRVALHHQHHLEQGIAGQRTLRVDRLHQSFERYVLVGVGGQVGFPGPGEQFPEGRVAGGVVPQDQGVDEEADEVVECFVGASGDRGSQGDVRARAQPAQQSGECGLEHHEQCGVGLLGQAEQRPVQLGVDPDRHGVTAVAGHLRPRPVERQIELVRNPVQGPLPEVQLAVHQGAGVLLRAEEFVQPQGVVGVLHRERGPRRRLPLEPGAERGLQVTSERTHGGAVARDVVHQQQQDVLVRADGEQRRPERQLGGQVEHVLSRIAQCCVQLTCRAGYLAQPHIDGVGSQRYLGRASVDLLEDRPQTLVPYHHIVQCLFENIRVQVPGDPERHRDVVRGIRPLQFVQEPQPVLRRRQRNPCRTLHRGQRGPG